MLYKNIIKKGVKDLSFIDNFLKEKLQGNDEVIINVSDKVYSKILCRYARNLEYNKDMFGTDYTLFYNDSKYSFEVLSRHDGGIYGDYYRLHIVDIEKFSKKQLYKRLSNLNPNMEKKLKDLYVELYKIQNEETLNPFKLSLHLNEVNKRISFKYEDYSEEFKILKQIEDIEG